MTDWQTIYVGEHNRSRLTITARRAAAGSSQERWIVRFFRRTSTVRTLDQCAAWLPREGRWDQLRWRPSGSHLVPPVALSTVEAWLREQCAGVVP